MPRYPLADVPVPIGGCPSNQRGMSRYTLADAPVPTVLETGRNGDLSVGLGLGA